MGPNPGSARRIMQDSHRVNKFPAAALCHGNRRLCCEKLVEARRDLTWVPLGSNSEEESLRAILASKIEANHGSNPSVQSMLIFAKFPLEDLIGFTYVSVVDPSQS